MNSTNIIKAEIRDDISKHQVQIAIKKHTANLEFIKRQCV